jgi:hypothetical protein
MLGSNPGSAVTMGDSLTFTGTIYPPLSYPSAELLIKLPDGFELLTSSPGFVPGSLSLNKREGRIGLNIVMQATKNFTIYVKALCDAQSIPVGIRTITYELYENDSAVNT